MSGAATDFDWFRGSVNHRSAFPGEEGETKLFGIFVIKDFQPVVGRKCSARLEHDLLLQCAHDRLSLFFLRAATGR
jgi:hypothetical protein